MVHHGRHLNSRTQTLMMRDCPSGANLSVWNILVKSEWSIMDATAVAMPPTAATRSGA
jgi:hypothetical protein